MREARIIVPSDRTMGIVHELIKEFGGATQMRAIGSWTAPSGEIVTEEVTIIDVAYIPTEVSDRKLYDLAWQYGQDAEQVAVYLRYGNGHVQMVQEFSCMNNGEFDWNSLVDDVTKKVHHPITNDDLTDVVEHAENVDLEPINDVF